MKTALRMFALLVAVAGLGAAAFVPAATHAQPRHTSMLATSPVMAALPAPNPGGGCYPGSCVVSPGSNANSSR